MDLKTYRQVFGKEAFWALAQRAGLTKGVMYQYVTKHTPMGHRQAWKLIKASEGQLTLEDLCPAPLDTQEDEEANRHA